tara:strand:- start:3655 stop:4302 length:648 start_codon:yes stop_codon:yes gene_type:complete
MKIFLDTADASIIRNHFSTGLIDGVTTNPTLILKSGRDPEEDYQEIKDIGVEDISMEIVTNEVDVFVSEGKRLREKFGDVTTIKVPCTPAGLRACKLLSDEGIRVNVTLIFSASQAILAAKAGAKYISPFVGRVEDNSFDGVYLVKEISALYREQMVTTQVLAASLRDQHSVAKCFEYGADVVTMPPAVFEKMYNHILTEKGLQLFDADWASVQK